MDGKASRMRWLHCCGSEACTRNGCSRRASMAAGRPPALLAFAPHGCRGCCHSIVLQYGCHVAPCLDCVLFCGAGGPWLPWLASCSQS